MSKRALLAGLFSQAALATVTLALGLELAIRATPMPDMSRAHQRAQLVTSSSGEILWGFLSEDQEWRLSTSEAAVDPAYLRLLLAYEDQRFLLHRGVDVAALARAAWQALRHGSRVSGGSTLTMQVVRMLEPRPRTLAAKIEQIFKALRLERSMGKQDILNLYLTLAPFGGNIEGVRAATLSYFGKEPKQLTLAEAALLAALPQSPETRRPDRFPAAALAARNRVLSALLARGVVEAKAGGSASREKLGAALRPLTRSAPHLATRLHRDTSGPFRETIPTLIDRDLQAAVEQIAKRAIAGWGDAVNVSIIVLRNRDASVAAYLGGVGFSAEGRKPYVDLVQAVRSPGSALKPFIYAMAFEKLIVHPETIITDQAIEIAGYRPENADGQFSGDISVREALIRSRNTTAVMILDRLGVDTFLARFRSAGRPLMLPPSGNAPGLAIALGGVGVTLEQLTWFYTTLPNAGVLNAIRFTPADPVQSLGQFIAPPAARATADILADLPPPAGYSRRYAADGGRRIGFKTGTSYGFRDAWAVGFDQLHTVGVWVGRPDGAAHLGAYGITAAAPLVMQVFDRLPVPSHDAAYGKAELGSLTSQRDLPKRLTRFDDRGRDDNYRPLEISFPRDGASIRADRARDGTVELPIVAQGGKPPYRWTFAGAAQPPSILPSTRWTLSGRGQLQISITDANGATAKSSFWVE